MTDLEEKGKWDKAAVDYQKVFALGQNEYNSSLLKFFEDRGMLWPGCRVIDVGCGVGKYGVYFAQRGCDVTLTDISDEMLDLASKNMESFDTPWRVYAGDFNDFTGREDVFKDGFDLSISTMSPAIHDLETIRKFSNMTKGYCFLSRFYDWKQPFRDALAKEMGIEMEQRMADGKEDCERIFGLIKEAGFDPEMMLVDYNWNDERTPEEMADYLSRHEWRDNEDARELKEKAIKACNALSGKNGKVDDCVNTKVAWIFWNTAEEE